MEWWLTLSLILGSLFFLLFIGIPVAFAFLVIDVVAMYLLWNGSNGLQQLVPSIFKSISVFTILPIPMFLFMGEIMFRTGLGPKVIASIGNWMGRIPGRLSLLSVGGGTLFSILAGSSVASTALLGSLLLPEMDKNRYKESMSIGPILGSAVLAVLIPPTILGVMLASLGGIPVGKFLVAIVMPGILLALIYILYIIIRCWLQPDLAPGYDVSNLPLRKKIMDTVKYIIPLGFIVFLVLGVIIIGVATPTQAAVLGAVGSLILSYFYGGLSWKVLKESLEGTLRVTSMIFLIVAGSAAFSQILSFTGATKGLIQAVSVWELSPLLLISVIFIILLLLGCFIEPLSIMMMTLPILMPIAQLYQFDLLWFGVFLLLVIQMATSTPPFGMDLFVMKSVSPKHTMEEIYRAVIPFLALNILLIIIIVFFPIITLWLPNLMH